MEWEKVQQLDSDVHEGDACGCSCTCDVVDAQNAKPHCEGTIGPESEPFKSQGHGEDQIRRYYLAEVIRLNFEFFLTPRTSIDEVVECLQKHQP